MPTFRIYALARQILSFTPEMDVKCHVNKFSNAENGGGHSISGPEVICVERKWYATNGTVSKPTFDILYLPCSDPSFTPEMGVKGHVTFFSKHRKRRRSLYFRRGGKRWGPKL